jgi:endonuclease/exonuclease/phosphatase family metal-dependent hydrolase
VYVLTWNLFHGRALPAAGRPLLVEFASTLAAWEWDVALLQEVPPWWTGMLAHAAGADARWSLTSRNRRLPARAAIGRRNPDLIGANGGGANAILVRGGGILEHHELELTTKPERRIVHGVRLASGAHVVNVHASTHPKHQRRADVGLALSTAFRWADGAPLIFGGDLNMRKPTVSGLEHAAGHWVDHVYVRAMKPVSAEVLDAGTLSDHRPVRAFVADRSPAA